MAQSVEHILGKDEVVSSILTSSSKPANLNLPQKDSPSSKTSLMGYKII